MQHYQRVCRDATSVLELGSGSGRILAALAQPDRELWGLELEPNLLRLGQQTVDALPIRKRHRVTIAQGNMERFTLGRRFQRVLLPYNGLYCLVSLRAAERCFRSVQRALEPGGIFAFDVWNADGLHGEGWSLGAAKEELVRFKHGGRTWTVFERCRRARPAQRLDVTYTYVPSGRGTAHTQVIHQRYYRSAELLPLLAECGFAVQTKHGSFSGTRFSQRSQRLVVTAKALG